MSPTGARDPSNKAMVMVGKPRRNRALIAVGFWEVRADVHMRITCIGLDPAALYLGIRLKRKSPSHAVRFVDRAPAPCVPTSLVCNPLKPRWQLKDAETLAALNQDLVRFDRIVVRAGDQQFQTQGM